MLVQRLALLIAIVLAACGPKKPARVPDVAMPPFTDHCAKTRCRNHAPEQIAAPGASAMTMKVDVLGFVGEYGKWSNVSEGYRMRLVERQRGEVQSVSLVASEGIRDIEYRQFVAPLKLTPGEYEIEIEGSGRRMLQFEARVAKVKLTDAQTRMALYVHRGTRVWLDEGVLTLARFRPAEAPFDVMQIEWLRDGKLVEKMRTKRPGWAWRLDDPAVTPWAFGETYPLPKDLADKPGTWTARIRGGREAVEVEFEIANGTLVERDRRTQIGGRYTVASPNLEIRPIAIDPGLVVELDLQQPGFKGAWEDPYVKRYAPALTPTPAMIRAMTRDPNLRKVLSEFNRIRTERPLVGRQVCLDNCTAAQRREQQRRVDNDAGVVILSRNRTAEQRAPQLREQALHIIDRRGGPFTANELPR